MSLPERFFAGLGRFSVRFRWPVILAWIAIAVVASITLPSMGSEVNNDNSQFLPSNAPSVQAADLATPLVGNVTEQSQVIIVGAVKQPRQAGAAPARLTPADLLSVGALTASVKDVPGVSDAKVIGISTDGAAVRIQVTINASQSDIATLQPIVDAIQTKTAEANAKPANVAAGISYHVAGPIATNVANQAASNKTSNDVQSFSILFIIILLLVIFRSHAGATHHARSRPAWPWSCPCASSAPSVRTPASRSRRSPSCSSYVVARRGHRLRAVPGVPRPRGAAARPRPLRTRSTTPSPASGSRSTASAATVILALLTLLLASFGLYHDLGVPLAIGVAVMLLAGLTLLPALLAIFGKAAFWPSRHISALPAGKSTRTAGGAASPAASCQPARR